MAYDAELADRIREQLADTRFTEKRMFGGLAFLVEGRISVAASHDGGLLARVPEGDYEARMGEPHVTEFVMRERAMRGWLRVGPEGVAADEQLRRWVAGGVQVAAAG